MKKILLRLSLMFAFFFSVNATQSCSADEIINEIIGPIGFGLPFQFNAPIPLAIINTEEYTKYPEIPMNLDLDVEIKKVNSQYSINNLKSAKLEEFGLSYIDSELGVKLDAIKNARVYLKVPEMAERLIATAENNTNENTITFAPVADLDLMNYFRSKEQSLIFEIQGRRVEADLLNVRVSTRFKVYVGL